MRAEQPEDPQKTERRVGWSQMLAILLGGWIGVAAIAAAEESPQLRYDWLTQGKRSGGLSVSLQGDGLRLSEFAFNDRGRGPNLKERVALDADGLIRSLYIEGKAYMGSPVDERFARDSAGLANWKSAAEAGSQADAQRAFYIAGESTPDQIGILARALLAAPGQSLALLPSGNARIESLAHESVTHAGETRQVELFGISGLGFEPDYVWLDADRNLFALAYGWMGLVPEGWAAVLPALQERQELVAAAHHQRLAERLTQRLPETWCIAPVRLLDIDAGRLLPDMAVRVSAGVIGAVGAVGTLQCDPGSTLDGGGRVLMPGLWDMHAHVSIGDGLLNIAAGVVAVRDLANDHERLLKLAAQMASGEVIGTRVMRSGFIDQKSPFAAPTGRLAESLEEALEMVRWYAERDYPHIKIYSSITPEWVRPIADEIHRHGMRLSGHIPSFMTAERAVRDGFDEIQHINMVFLNFLAGPRDDTRTPVRFVKVAEEAGDLDLESAEVKDFIALLRQRDIVLDPTVSIFDSMFRHRAGELDPSYASIADHLPPSVQRGLRAPGFAVPDEKAARYAASADALLKMIGALHRAGVRLVPGTDAMAGFTLHRELELYVAAGIPAADVLRIATIGAATIADSGGELGRIAPGYRAELVLLDGDPLTDISNIRRTVLTLRGDRYYRAADLHQAVGIRPFVAPESGHSLGVSQGK